MIELFVLIVVLGTVWLAGSVILLMFKLMFGLIGGVFSLVGGLLALVVGGVVMLALLPVFALVLLPLCLPLLLVAGLVWLIVRATRQHPAPVTAHTP